MKYQILVGDIESETEFILSGTVMFTVQESSKERCISSTKAELMRRNASGRKYVQFTPISSVEKESRARTTHGCETATYCKTVYFESRQAEILRNIAHLCRKESAKNSRDTIPISNSLERSFARPSPVIPKTIGCLEKVDVGPFYQQPFPTTCIIPSLVRWRILSWHNTIPRSYPLVFETRASVLDVDFLHASYL